ncbi:hypothetical protein AVEN_217521-1 [Araneus ventricosus]|uniref:Uncharacterized protein n=1 Tax=Araneus ventricosus TaxID=182803 RepID=A0A4Y2RNB5_ARAVE|nr:hypothetical protein AVEN_46302-1 [Araneus ventricosus]GBN34507.1 hypothetical protein AVEN_181953-1 [Araneus ventricosus]GBN76742.1 hypothetical protein AVEN_168378-1 [Araneus ventricosus]GBN76749.1 hypothetical protein AVEN_217521-1 [Araneus ventricosus]
MVCYTTTTGPIAAHENVPQSIISPPPACVWPERFNLAETSFCSCGGIGTPIHYSTVCLLTTSYHMAPPSQQHQPVWFRSVANNSTSRRKMHNLLHFLQRETSLFRPDPN